MLKPEKLPSTNSTKSGVHLNCAQIQENEHTPGIPNSTQYFESSFSSSEWSLRILRFHGYL